MNLRVLFEDEHVIVCYKPSGVPTQTKKIGTMDMVSLLRNYLRAPYVAVIHRLDQPVEGILVFAKTPFAAKELSKEMQQRNTFGKYYKAVLSGVPLEKSGTLENYLVKDGKTNTSRVAKKDDKDAKKAVLAYEVMEEMSGQALVQIKLETGRHHQIRVQMAEIGCPIWGDTKYGLRIEPREKTWKQIALCAYRLEFVHPKTKKRMEFEIQPEGEIFRNWNKLDKPGNFQ